MFSPYNTSFYPSSSSLQSHSKDLQTENRIRSKYNPEPASSEKNDHISSILSNFFINNNNDICKRNIKNHTPNIDKSINNLKKFFDKEEKVNTINSNINESSVEEDFSFQTPPSSPRSKSPPPMKKRIPLRSEICLTTRKLIYIKNDTDGEIGTRKIEKRKLFDRIENKI